MRRIRRVQNGRKKRNENKEMRVNQMNCSEYPDFSRQTLWNEQKYVSIEFVDGTIAILG